MNKENDPQGVFAMRRFVLGEASDKDTETLRNRANEDNYGDSKILPLSSEGMEIDATYKGQAIKYFVPSGADNMSGRDLWVTKAYRVDSKEEDSMNVREVQIDSELEAVAQGIRERMRRILYKK